ncbi:MAG: ribokinase [Phycisphaeraceae bacterium]
MSQLPRILVVGAINLDIAVEVDRLPKEGETLIGRRLTLAPGGKGANQAVAAAKLGAFAAFCGRVGNDEWGRLATGRLSQSGVNTTALIIDREKPTGAAIIHVEPGGQNQITAVGGANLGVIPADVDRMLTSASKLNAVMLTLETPLDTVRYVIRRCMELKIPTVLDAAPPATYPLVMLRGVTVISPNQTEAAALTGVEVKSLDEARAAAIKLREGTGAPHVIMKLGEQGALWLSDEGELHVPAHRVTAIDATAAGDAFTAALTVEWCRTNNLSAALRYACAAGAIAVTKLGAQASLPTDDEVRRMQVTAA